MARPQIDRVGAALADGSSFLLTDARNDGELARMFENAVTLTYDVIVDLPNVKVCPAPPEDDPKFLLRQS